ncbi:MAG: hypothetical protein PHS42_10310 [Sulfurimonas sp.]|nr:hypothetical protein [Sulfurimonas sp.]MDD3835840.1 hypothetical protein [Sulfurimonas sp.]
MINEAVLNYVVLFVLLEFYEIYWQKAPTIMGMLIRMHKYYSRSIFLFLIMQPTFYFSVGFAMLTDYHWASILMLLIKTSDIATKILLLEQVFIKRQLSHELSLILLAPINSFLPYIGLFTYPIFIILSLNGSLF